MLDKKENIGSQINCSNWQLKDIQAIYEQLEHPNWAPWLEAQPESLAGRVVIFPKGQLVLKNNSGDYLASLSMNRINWDGNQDTLPSWDEVAGDPTTYENTYNVNGNTLTMMSMNVHPQHTGEGYARLLIEKAGLLAIDLGVDYLVGSFRPNHFGKYKIAHIDEKVNFEDYCKLKRGDGLPIDGWLRNLTRNGMQPLKVDHQAMTVLVSLETLNEYQNEYKPQKWIQTDPEIWECEEVGTWNVDSNTHQALYIESNLWGLIWKRTGLL